MADPMVKPVPIPDRFADIVGSLYRAQHRAEQSTDDADRMSAQSIARQIIGNLSLSDGRAFSAAIHQELAAALVLGCPNSQEIREAADVLERSLEFTDASDPRLGSRAAVFAHISVLLAIAEQDSKRLRAAIATAQRGCPKVEPASIPSLIATMMALSFVRQIDHDLIRLSVDEPAAFGFATLQAEKRVAMALRAAGNRPATPSFYLASARIHIQYAVYQEQISNSERNDHVGYSLMALSKLQPEGFALLRRDVPFGVVVAASVMSALAVGLAFAAKELWATGSTRDQNDLLDQLIYPSDLSPRSLTAAARRLAGEYDSLARTISNQLPTQILLDPKRFDIRPLLDIIDEFSNRETIKAIAVGMWRDISSTAAAAQLCWRSGEL